MPRADRPIRSERGWIGVFHFLARSLASRRVALPSPVPEARRKGKGLRGSDFGGVRAWHHGSLPAAAGPGSRFSSPHWGRGSAWLGPGARAGSSGLARYVKWLW